MGNQVGCHLLFSINSILFWRRLFGVLASTMSQDQGFLRNKMERPLKGAENLRWRSKRLRMHNMGRKVMVHEPRLAELLLRAWPVQAWAAVSKSGTRGRVPPLSFALLCESGSWVARAKLWGAPSSWPFCEAMRRASRRSLHVSWKGAKSEPKPGGAGLPCAHASSQARVSTAVWSACRLWFAFGAETWHPARPWAAWSAPLLVSVCWRQAPSGPFLRWRGAWGRRRLACLE
mmetsp:Transcript_878/g.2112  ORF Transcript_878/g.2112 Transcript_878/m.2112 type:complete len:232 (-) Transcript_878:1275-1970(-)